MGVPILGRMYPTFASTTRFSFQQFVEVVEDLGKQAELFHWELLNGRIYMSPPAGGPHGTVQGNLSRIISSHVHEQRAGRVFGSSTGYHLPSNDVVEPDVAFVAQSRVAAMPQMKPGKYLQVVPDLAVEILSLSDPQRDLEEKREIYRRNGVREYWIADPLAKTLLILRLESERYVESAVTLSGGFESAVLPGLRIEARDVFDGLP